MTPRPPPPPGGGPGPLHVVWCPTCNEQVLRTRWPDTAAAFAESHALTTGHVDAVVRVQRR